MYPDVICISYSSNHSLISLCELLQGMKKAYLYTYSVRGEVSLLILSLLRGEECGHTASCNSFEEVW